MSKIVCFMTQMGLSVQTCPFHFNSPVSLLMSVHINVTHSFNDLKLCSVWGYYKWIDQSFTNGNLGGLAQNHGTHGSLNENEDTYSRILALPRAGVFPSRAVSTLWQWSQQRDASHWDLWLGPPMLGCDGIGGWPGTGEGHERSHRSWLGKFQSPGLVTGALDRNDNGIFIIPKYRHYCWSYWQYLIKKELYGAIIFYTLSWETDEREREPRTVVPVSFQTKYSRKGKLGGS